MQGELHRPVEFLRELGHHVVAGGDVDRAEEVRQLLGMSSPVGAEQHRPYGEEADQHRRNRQQDQRHGHDPGRFVRLVRVVVVVPMGMIGLVFVRERVFVFDRNPLPVPT